MLATRVRLAARRNIFNPENYPRYLHLVADEGLYTDAAGAVPVTSDGDLVRRWDDQSGNARHMGVASDGVRPTYKTAIVNGHHVVRFAGSQAMQDISTTAATWKLLHDGSPYTLFIIWKPSGTISSTQRFFCTNNASTSNAGLMVACSATNRFDFHVAKGTAGTPRFFIESASYTVTPALWHIAAMRYDPTLSSNQARMDSDGSFGACGEATHAGSASSANPHSYLRIGEDTDGNYRLSGDIAEIVLFAEAFDDERYERTARFYADKYAGYNLKFFTPGATVVQHDGGGDPDHNAWAGACVAANGDLVIAYNKSDSHTSVYSRLIVRRSSDRGVTWGAEQVLFDTDLDGGGTDKWLVGGLTRLADGRLTLAVGKRSGGGSAGSPDGIGYFESGDDGETWSGVHLVDSGFTSAAYEGGGIVELASGDLLFPYYGLNTGNTRYSCRFSRSTDGGDTWADESYVYNGQAGTFSAAEPGMAQRADGSLVCLIRNVTSTTSHCFESTDDGATWTNAMGVGANLGAGIGASLMHVTKVPGGGWVHVVRNANVSGYPAYLIWSPDEGYTWQVGRRFPASPNFAQVQMVYGQVAAFGNGDLVCAYSTEGASSEIADVLLARTT